jgi:hypothetical protein
MLLIASLAGSPAARVRIRIKSDRMKPDHYQLLPLKLFQQRGTNQRGFDSKGISFSLESASLFNIFIIFLLLVMKLFVFSFLNPKPGYSSISISNNFLWKVVSCQVLSRFLSNKRGKRSEPQISISSKIYARLPNLIRTNMAKSFKFLLRFRRQANVISFGADVGPGPRSKL